MRRQLVRRVESVAQRRGPDAPLFVRLVTVLRPDMPDEAQDRWIDLAERLVDDELRAKRKTRILLWSQVTSPGVVSVSGPHGHYMVEVHDHPTTPTGRIVERSAGRW